MNRYRRLPPVLQHILKSSQLPRSTLHTPSISGLINQDRSRYFATSQTAQSTNFDTLKVVQRLEAHGFTPEQSKAVMELLKDVIDESVVGLTRTMVTREEQDKVALRRKNQELIIDCLPTKS